MQNIHHVTCHRNARIAAVALGIGLGAFLTACGNDKQSTPAASSSGASSTAAAGPEIDIAVIPKGTTHDYWKSLHAGAIKAQEDEQAKGLNVKIIWKGPLQEDDRNGQTDIVETFVTQGVKGIVLAPLDSEALVRPVEDAVAKNIPVVICDSALDSKKIASFVATDNYKGGKLAAQKLIMLTGGKAKVIVLRYAQGSASTEAREQGFFDGVKAAPGIQIISGDQYAGPTVDSAQRSAENVLARYGKQADAIFTPNESSTNGMLNALKEAGLIGKVKFVGFDTSPDLMAALKAGQIDALVAQNPFYMGDESVETMVDVIQKKQVPASIDTGVSVVTKDNLTDPKIAALINPPLDKYLKDE